MRGHPNQAGSHLNMITSTKILFPNKVTFMGPGCWLFNIFEVGGNSTHNTNQWESFRRKRENYGHKK